MLLIDPFFLLYFFPTFISVYYLIFRKIILANIFIILCSIYFYETFGLAQLPVLIVPLVFDYVLGILLFRTDNILNKKILLAAGVILNIGLLAYFKYANFLLSIVTHFFHTSQAAFPPLNILLPLGISFITFQRISYIADVYRQKTTPETNFIRYATYACLFPHLISGPIIRFANIKSQLGKRVVNLETVFEGSKIFTVGFGYKILIADQLYLLEVYLANNLHSLHFLEAFLLVLSFTFRLYFDFLGYSLMAVGLAKFLGFDFPYNFNAPYQSKSITEFWRRWNITLSSWLRDYLYIPLGGNRKGNIRTYVNLMITMLLAGLWHGANWNFILWGGLHGTFLTIERICMKRNIHINIPTVFKNMYAFVLIMLSWIVFRFTNFSDIQHIFAALLRVRVTAPSHVLINLLVYTLPSIVLAIWVSFFLKEPYLPKIKPRLLHVFLLVGVFFLSLCFTLLKGNFFFIYNQF